jgi:hypothetical protein
MKSGEAALDFDRRWSFVPHHRAVKLDGILGNGVDGRCFDDIQELDGSAFH